MQRTDAVKNAGLDANDVPSWAKASSKTDQPTLRIAKSISEVEELRQVWTSWLCHPSSDIDCYLMKIRLSALTLRPHVMVVYRNGLADCMLVGRLDHKRMSVNIGYLQCFLPKAWVLTFVRGGLLGKQSPENCEFLVREIVASLRQGEADAAELKNVRVESPLYGAARSLPSFLCRDHCPLLIRHRSLNLPDSFQAFFNGLSRKTRHNLRSHAQLLLRKFSGNMRIRCFRRVDEVECLIRDTEEVAKKTYQRALGFGFGDRVENRQELQMTAERGTLRGYVMYIAQQPCAFMIGVQYQRTFHGLFMGFDPKYSRFSPGTFLLMHCIQESFAANGHDRPLEIDFGPGDQRFKLMMSNQEWEEGSVSIFAATLKGMVLNFPHTMYVLMARFTHGILAETDLGKRIKIAWRLRYQGNR